MANFERNTSTIDTDAQKPRTWTVRRSSGELDPGWTESSRETGDDGVVRVEVTKSDGEGGEYVKTVRLDKLEAIARQIAQQDLGEEAVDAANSPVVESPYPQETTAPETFAANDAEREAQIRSGKAIIQALKATYDALGLDVLSRSGTQTVDEATMRLNRVRTLVGYANRDPYDKINQETLTNLAALQELLAQQRHTVSYSMPDYELDARIKRGLQGLALQYANLIPK